MNHSARRINALAAGLGARRYLEIGVAHGTTFRDVALPHRTAVDPAFQFDTAALANPRTRFFQRTSDAFFADEPLAPPYDVVFLDGLHRFEQVVRDFSNAIVRTRRRSVIVLDDTVPTTEYSALPDQDAARRHRDAAGIKDVAWHGDAFKMVFYIHDFWPSLNYRTISGSGNPQTLVWRSTAGVRAPRFDNLESISRLSFFDMRDHWELMRAATEEEAIALCLAEIGPA